MPGKAICAGDTRSRACELKFIAAFEYLRELDRGLVRAETGAKLAGRPGLDRSAQTAREVLAKRQCELVDCLSCLRHWFRFSLSAVLGVCEATRLGFLREPERRWAGNAAAFAVACPSSVAIRT